jgi:hypothetical protein
MNPSDRSKPGFFYESIKKSKNNRVKLKNLTLLKRDVSYFSFIEKLPDNLVDFKFNILNYFNLSMLASNGGIKCSDDGLLVPDNQNMVSISELYK